MPRDDDARLVGEITIMSADFATQSHLIAIRSNLLAGELNFSAQDFEGVTEPRIVAKSTIDLDR